MGSFPETYIDPKIPYNDTTVPFQNPQYFSLGTWAHTICGTVVKVFKQMES